MGEKAWLEKRRGQSATETLFVLAVVLAILSMTIPVYLENNELSNVLAAARAGAVRGANLKALGVSTDDENIPVGHPAIRVEAVDLVMPEDPKPWDGTWCSEPGCVDVAIFLSGHENIPDEEWSSVRASIAYHARRSIAWALGTVKTTENPSIGFGIEKTTGRFYEYHVRVEPRPT
ncbi:MAG: hypothetical protein DRO11_01880 [Methanobacteriota archaeon]|nr:MAG: hypothetical protein DRO11_01880 [Euryarchaeota archaeon]